MIRHGKIFFQQPAREAVVVLPGKPDFHPGSKGGDGIDNAKMTNMAAPVAIIKECES